MFFPKIFNFLISNVFMSSRYTACKTHHSQPKYIAGTPRNKHLYYDFLWNLYKDPLFAVENVARINSKKL